MFSASRTKLARNTGNARTPDARTFAALEALVARANAGAIERLLAPFGADRVATIFAAARAAGVAPGDNRAAAVLRAAAPEALVRAPDGEGKSVLCADISLSTDGTINRGLVAACGAATDAGVTGVLAPFGDTDHPRTTLDQATTALARSRLARYTKPDCVCAALGDERVDQMNIFTDGLLTSCLAAYRRVFQMWEASPTPSATTAGDVQRRRRGLRGRVLRQLPLPPVRGGLRPRQRSVRLLVRLLRPLRGAIRGAAPRNRQVGFAAIREAPISFLLHPGPLSPKAAFL